MSLRLALRPSPLGFLLGIAVVTFWALLWIAFLTQLLDAPQKNARQPGSTPVLARATADAPGLTPGARSLEPAFTA